jgi:hypothetical protein
MAGYRSRLSGLRPPAAAQLFEGHEPLDGVEREIVLPELAQARPLAPQRGGKGVGERPEPPTIRKSVRSAPAGAGVDPQRSPARARPRAPRGRRRARRRGPTARPCCGRRRRPRDPGRGPARDRRGRGRLQIPGRRRVPTAPHASARGRGHRRSRAGRRCPGRPGARQPRVRSASPACRGEETATHPHWNAEKQPPIIWAIAEGRECAREVDAHLTGRPSLLAARAQSRSDVALA